MKRQALWEGLADSRLVGTMAPTMEAGGGSRSKGRSSSMRLMEWSANHHGGLKSFLRKEKHQDYSVAQAARSRR